MSETEWRSWADFAGGEQIRELMVQAPAEGFCATLILTCLPASLYIVIHWSLMHYWVHVWSIVLLVSAPVLFLSILEVSTCLAHGN